MAEPKPVAYLLQSVVRGRANRTARAAVPGRMPFVQKLAGGRIVIRRARPARISEAVLITHLAEIKAAVAKHHIVVTTMAGQPIDLDTFEVGTLAASSPPPNPPLDSAKNDKNEKVGYKVPGSPEGTTSDSQEPELLRPSVLLSPDSGGSEPPVDTEEEELEVEPETTKVSPETSPSDLPEALVPSQQPQRRGKRGRS